MDYTQHPSEGNKLCDEWYHMLSYLELNSVLKMVLHMQAVTEAKSTKLEDPCAG